MRVLHINTSTKGGAAKACIRQHKALLKNGINSSFLSKFSKSSYNIPNHYDFYTKEELYPPLELKAYLEDKINKKYTTKIEGDVSLKPIRKQISDQHLDIDCISSPFSGTDILKHEAVIMADIINLHWVSDFLDYPSFFQNVNKPIVWTMHDMNPFSGLFHYVVNKKISNIFNDKDRKFREIKYSILSKIQSVYPVALSSWLKNAADDSNVFHNKCKLIPNSIDLTTYKSWDKKFSKDIFKLKNDKKTLLFVSESIDNKRKGFTLLLKAIKSIDTEKINLLVVGNASSELKGQLPNARFIGYINDDRLMSLAYSASDLFILPSIQDNLPNTMLESMACGTPVMSFKTGGMLDHLKEGKTGILVEDMSGEALGKKLDEFINGSYRFDRHAIRQYAENYFAPEIQAEKYIELYKSILQ